MKATVVIPNYNGRHYLEDCLSSLLLNTSLPAIIVVDNGSTDGSKELILSRFPEVKLIALEENTGFSKAVNLGIQAADTEYVILLNNDTKADSRMVQELITVMDYRPNTFSAGAKMLMMHSPGQIDDAGDFYTALGNAYARGKGKDSGNYTKSDRIFAACAGAAIYRKSLFEKVGYFDEEHFAYLEDIDIGYRARIFGYDNYFAPSAIVYHAGSATSGSRYNEFKVRLSARNNIYLISKNMPPFQILLNFIFFMFGFMIKYLFFKRKGMGSSYYKGLREGLRLAGSESGKRHRVMYKKENLTHYIQIQLELWINVFRRFIEN